MNPIEHKRPDPDELLASLKKEEESAKRGKLRIFFGMSPGVGKTYTMLETAKTDLSKGVDVIVGYVEAHNRPETNALLEGFEIIPRKQINYKGRELEEMDLDAILLRHPYLVLVDELAHTNAPGSRHLKRYQDVMELLDSGINVYTTVNVQHLESRTDTVAQITGITVRETIPDEIFENADEIELVDITPNELLDRLADGKVYAPEHSKEAVQHFFRKGNITALREMSLRMVADRVDKQLKSYMQQKRISGPWKSGLHLMVLIGPSPSSASLIRWAKNMAYTMGADLTALHIESSRILNEKEKEQLAKNISLAKQFGAEFIMTSGNDLVKTALETARKENITHIIVGKSGEKKSWFKYSPPDFVDRLIKESGNIDIYLLGSELTSTYKRKREFSFPAFTSNLNEYGLALLVVILTTLICMLLDGEIGYQSVSFILLFVVSMLATFLRVGPILLAASISACVWNYFFIPPRFAVHIDKTQDILTFVMFFIIALMNGILTSRVKKQEKLARDREERTNALFRLTKELADASNTKDIVEIGMRDIRKFFSIEAYFILQDGNGKLVKKFLPKELKLSDSEYSIASWVFRHDQKAGKFTDTLPSGEFTYYPLIGTRVRPGTVAVRLSKPFIGDQDIFWDTFLTQISIAFERQYLSQLAIKANFMDESDRLYKTLYSSISNELRLPVTTIMKASDVLLSSVYPDETRNKLYNEIFISSRRLYRLIENLLNMSRLESGRVTAHLEWCNIREIFDKVTQNMKILLQPYRVDIVVPESMPLVKIDPELMEQVIFNLVHNSCKFAYENTTIRLKAFYDNGNLIVQEMDRGPGLKPDVLASVFNKFYKSDSEKSGGAGLGLAIAKGFVEAHKGTIVAENRQNGGVRFTIKIPTERQLETSK